MSYKKLNIDTIEMIVNQTVKPLLILSTLVL